jgi:hypothetical protein
MSASGDGQRSDEVNSVANKNAAITVPTQRN